MTEISAESYWNARHGSHVERLMQHLLPSQVSLYPELQSAVETRFRGTIPSPPYDEDLTTYTVDGKTVFSITVPSLPHTPMFVWYDRENSCWMTPSLLMPKESYSYPNMKSVFLALKHDEDVPVGDYSPSTSSARSLIRAHFGDYIPTRGLPQYGAKAISDEQIFHIEDKVVFLLGYDKKGDTPVYVWHDGTEWMTSLFGKSSARHIDIGFRFPEPNVPPLAFPDAPTASPSRAHSTVETAAKFD